MIRLLVVIGSIVILLAGAVSAQELDGTVTLYADEAGTDCSIVAPDAGIFEVYAFFVNASQPAVAIQFSAPVPSCLNATFLGDISPYELTIGNSQTGITIAFSECLSTPIYLVTIVYFATRLADPCCHYPVIPDPNWDQIKVADCFDRLNYAVGDIAIVNQDESCRCTFPVPVESTTWGKIKAQYR